MSITVSDLEKFESELIIRGRARSTAHKYFRHMTEFMTWESGQPMRSQGEQLVRWVADCRDSGQAAATVKLKLAAARAFGAHIGVSLGEYKAPPLPPARPHPLPGGIADVRKMLAVETGAGRSAVAFGGLAGMRVQESVSIDRKHYKLSRSRRVLEIHGKGGKIRIVPVSSELDGYIDLMPLTGRMVPLCNSGARAAITRIATKAGVVAHDGGEVSSHDLRATFATEVYNKTSDIRLVQELLGHASVQTTQIYIGISDDKADRGVEF